VWISRGSALLLHFFILIQLGTRQIQCILLDLWDLTSARSVIVPREHRHVRRALPRTRILRTRQSSRPAVDTYQMHPRPTHLDGSRYLIACIQTK
jgi:hypothetical protein